MAYAGVKITVVPVLYFGGQIQYWWSINREAPYLVGAEGLDFDGPYASSRAAFDAIRKVHDDAAVVSVLKDKVLLSTETEIYGEPQICSTDLHIHLPRDEFSELAYLDAPSGVEYQALKDDLQFTLQVKPDYKDKFLVSQVRFNRDKLMSGRLFTPLKANATTLQFYLPVTVNIYHREPNGFAGAGTVLDAIARFPELYRGESIVTAIR